MISAKKKAIDLVYKMFDAMDIQDGNLYIDLNNSIEFNKKNYIMNINFDKFRKKLKLIS